MGEMPPYNPENDSQHLASELRKLKGEKRSQTLDYIIHCLERGKIEQAKIECSTNGDKLESFPEVVAMLSAQLFTADEYNPFKLFSSLNKDE